MNSRYFARLDRALKAAAETHGSEWRRTSLKNGAYVGSLRTSDGRVQVKIEVCPNGCCVAWTNTAGGREVGVGEGILPNDPAILASDVLHSALHHFGCTAHDHSGRKAGGQ